MARTKKKKNIVTKSDRIVKKKPGKKNNLKPTIPVLIDNLIKEADIILEILDARFIEKTRNIEIEKKVMALGKPLIYILNKSDLVDIEKLKMEHSFEDLKPNLFFSSKNRKGSTTLRRMIKIEVKKIGKNIVKIGLIGYPNTGKSSLANILVGKVVSKTSSEAGFTRGTHKLKILPGVYLIDTPGIIPPEEKIYGGRLMTKHTTIGATTWHRAKDPEVIIFELMKEYKGILEAHYGIDTKGDVELLLETLGRKLCYLQKGGVVDENRTAKYILREWQEGKIMVC